MNNKVKFLRGTATEYEASTKDNDTFYYTTDDEKLYLGNKEITGGGVTIDDTLSDTSKNPVQNKVINAALNSKANLSDIPTTLPANGGNADTLDGLHESSFAQNIGVWNEGDIKDLLLACQKSGFVWIQPGVTGMPNDNTYWFGIADCHTVHRQLIVRDINNSVTYCMCWNNGTQTWASWRNLADGGNAAKLESHPASDFALKTDIPTSLPANGGNADTVDGKHASDFALKTDIPTTLPANGGIADTARQTVSPNAKARLWEDSEGGNLRLASPDGNHSVEMDLYNNSFRMYFTDNGESTFPVDYNSTTKKFNINGNADTLDGKHASDFMPISGETRKYGLIRMNASDGIRVRHIDGNDTEFDGALYLNYNSPNAPIYMNGGNTAIHSGNIGSQSVNYANSANAANYSNGAQGNIGLGCLRNISAGTGDLTAGSSPLATGAIYLVYE